MKTLLCLILIIYLALLTGCGPDPDEGVSSVITDDDFTILYQSDGHYIFRFIDRQMGAVCWVYNGFKKKGGISCIPWNQLGG